MGILRWLRGKKQPRMEAAASEQCGHPVQYQEVLHEDPSDRHKVTGIICARCGQRVPAAAA